MYRITEQTAVLCGMVKTPIHPATKETTAHGEYPYCPPRTRMPHLRDEARNETESKAEDAHYSARLRRSLAHRDLCEGLDELVEFAEDYLEERQPFRVKLGEVYDQL